MIGYTDNQLAAQVAAQVQNFGFNVVRAESGRAVLRRLRDAGDVDVLLLDIDLPDPGFPYLLSQIRAMPQGKRLTVVLTIDVRPGALPRPLEDSLRYARESQPKSGTGPGSHDPRLRTSHLSSTSTMIESGLYRTLEISAKLPPSDQRKAREEILRAALDREDVLVTARLDRQRAAAQVRQESLRRFLEGDAYASIYPVSLTLDHGGSQAGIAPGNGDCTAGGRAEGLRQRGGQAARPYGSRRPAGI